MQHTHIRAQSHVKTVRFIYEMMRRPNFIVAYLARLCCISSNSPLGKNVAFLNNKYGIQFSHNLSSNVSPIYGANELHPCKHGFFICACRRHIIYYTLVFVH